MNALPSQAAVVPNGSYGVTRFNAIRHAVLSRYTVLPWEDGTEYLALLGALVAEHAPEGPTEDHLVEELAGIIWRKRRLRMAEAAVYRAKLRHDAGGYSGGDEIVGAALLPITGSTEGKATVGKAISATPSDTARELRDLRRDQLMTQRALNILEAGAPDAYERSVAALHDDTRDYWQECLEDVTDGRLTSTATAEALKAWIEHHWSEWYEQPTAELQHRGAIRDQAIGVAYAARGLDVSARYEVHLDRKLERTLAMLFRLRELRQPATAA
jgi:hypothetical protein